MKKILSQWQGFTVGLLLGVGIALLITARKDSVDKPQVTQRHQIDHNSEVRKELRLNRYYTRLTDNMKKKHYKNALRFISRIERLDANYKDIKNLRKIAKENMHLSVNPPSRADLSPEERKKQTEEKIKERKALRAAKRLAKRKAREVKRAQQENSIKKK